MRGEQGMGQSKRKDYTISEIARLSGVTVASVSKYVKRNGLKPVRLGKNNSKYFDSSVLDEIESYYQRKNEKQQEASSEHHPATKDDVIDELRARVRDLQATNELLRDELKVKNDQIADAVRLADQAQRLDLTTHNQQKVLPEPEVKTTEVKDKSEHDDEKKAKKFKFWPFE